MQVLYSPNENIGGASGKVNRPKPPRVSGQESTAETSRKFFRYLGTVKRTTVTVHEYHRFSFYSLLLITANIAQSNNVSEHNVSNQHKSQVEATLF